jgi:hypothetical protein
MSTPCDMQSFIVWMIARIAERETAQGDEALERAEGNGDNLGICGCAAHEGGENEVFCHLS